MENKLKRLPANRITIRDVKGTDMKENSKIILFICEGNSGRSQMAEAFFNQISKKWKAISAGTDIDKEIHPLTIQLMKEVGIDVSKQKPKLLTVELMKNANKIIVMDSDLLKSIPSIYLSKSESWKIDKLLGKSIKQVRKIRNNIKENVEQLLSNLSPSDKSKRRSDS
jgi:protein-tyrosine-phosphatase